jgi:Protein of unknown function (DUF1761)
MTAVGILIATPVAFIVSGAYYSAVPQPKGAQPAPKRAIAATIIVELARNLIVATLIARILAAADWKGPADGVLLGLGLWAIPLVLLAGAVFHEGAPMGGAALHAIDWLIKLVVVGAIVGLIS